MGCISLTKYQLDHMIEVFCMNELRINLFSKTRIKIHELNFLDCKKNINLP